MWEIQNETVFGAAHKLRAVEGEGERLHGHNWRVRVFVRASALAPEGWVLDFAELGRTLRGLVEPWEHVYLNEVSPWDKLNPTAENIARYLAEEMQRLLGSERVFVHRVEVFETDECCATFYRA